MKKILFLIHDLGPGGAEKVLVNLVNNMDKDQFDITVMALFGGGVNEQFLNPHIRLINCFQKAIRGNSHLLKLLTPRQLHKWLIKERYDIEVSYLEGPSARIISGCPNMDTKLVSWIHCTMHSPRELALGFRSFREAKQCFARFHKTVFVSTETMEQFQALCPLQNATVLYNTNDTPRICALAEDPCDEICPLEKTIKLISMGKLEPVKGFDRLIRIHSRLRDEGFALHTYILGEGSKKSELIAARDAAGLTDSITFLGYQENPYKFIKRCDVFVCSSHSEGFSTSATEALIVGTPVVTTLVSGMKEMLGENNEFGIVTENNEEALYQGLKKLLTQPGLQAHYKAQAVIRGEDFSTENTIQAVEKMLNAL